MQSKLAQLRSRICEHEMYLEERCDGETNLIVIPKRIAIEIALMIVDQWPVESAALMKDHIEELKKRM